MANCQRILSSELNGFWFPKAGLCIVAAERTSLTRVDFSFNGVLFCIIYAALAECDFQEQVLCNLSIGARIIPSEEGIREPLLDLHKSMGPGMMHLWVHRLLVEVMVEPHVRVTVTEGGSWRVEESQYHPVWKKDKRKFQGTAFPSILNFFIGFSLLL